MSDLVLGSTTVLSDSSGTPTIQSGVTFPAGMVLQTVRDNYTSQTVASSQVKVHELTLTTKKASSKLAFWLHATIGGTGDGDNIQLTMTLETGTTANTPSSSNLFPTDNRGPGTATQNNGYQLYIDVMPIYPDYSTYAMHTYTTNDVITTSYAKDTQITMGVFIDGGCYINKCEARSNTESGLTTLIVQEIAT